jgi:hypothetical protein
MKKLSFWNNLRIYAYGALFALGILPLFAGKNQSQLMNQLIVFFTILVLLFVMVIEGMRFYLKKNGK